MTSPPAFFLVDWLPPQGLVGFTLERLKAHVLAEQRKGGGKEVQMHAWPAHRKLEFTDWDSSQRLVPIRALCLVHILKDWHEAVYDSALWVPPALDTILHGISCPLPPSPRLTDIEEGPHSPLVDPCFVMSSQSFMLFCCPRVLVSFGHVPRVIVKAVVRHVPLPPPSASCGPCWHVKAPRV